MKPIILVFLLIAVVLTKRHNADPITQCLQNTCQTQFKACDQDSQCIDALKKCVAQQERNWSQLDSGLQCLQGQKKAYSAMECIFEKCIGFHDKK